MKCIAQNKKGERCKNSAKFYQFGFCGINHKFYNSNWFFLGKNQWIKYFIYPFTFTITVVLIFEIEQIWTEFKSGNLNIQETSMGVESYSPVFQNSDTIFNILILPFKEICTYGGKNYDAGWVLTERIREMTKKNRLKILSIYYDSYNQENLQNEMLIKRLQKYHNADMLVYGAYQTSDCSSNGDKICINYITDEKWDLKTIGSNLEWTYNSGGIEALREGKLQEKIEYIALFISTIAQIKSISRKRYLEKLQQLLSSTKSGQLSKEHVYSEIADMQKDEGLLKTPLILYRKIRYLLEEINDTFNLAVTYSRIGDIYSDLGYLDSALINYNIGYQLDQELYKNHPDSTQVGNSLAVSLEEIGDVQSKLGNLELAKNRYEEGNNILQNLCRTTPDSYLLKNLERV